MWSAELVEKERNKYKSYSQIPSIDYDFEKIKYKVSDMSDYPQWTDERLKKYIFDLKLSNYDTATLLDYVKISTDNFIKDALRFLLFIILITYCLPVLLSVFLLSIFEMKFEYKKPGKVPVSIFFFQVLIAILFSTTFYYSIYNYL